MLLMITSMASLCEAQTMEAAVYRPDTTQTLSQQISDIQSNVNLDQDYVMNLKENDPTMYCLAQNAFFEARSESLENKIAVVEVVKNRLDSGNYAGTLCQVVHQKVNGICQFSWVCHHLGFIPLKRSNGSVDEPVYRQWYDSVLAAYTVQNHLISNIVPGATNFYAQRTVRPDWSRYLKKVAVIGGHTFMKPRD